MIASHEPSTLVQLEIQNSINDALGSEKSRNKAKKTIRNVEQLEFHLEKF